MKTTVGFADHKFEKGGILVQSATHNYIYAYCSLRGRNLNCVS